MLVKNKGQSPSISLKPPFFEITRARVSAPWFKASIPKSAAQISKKPLRPDLYLEWNIMCLGGPFGIITSRKRLDRSIRSALAARL
jgi:hypothetical protein